MAALLVIVALVWAWWFQHAYGTLNPFAVPEKMTVTSYDRQFVDPGPPMTWAQVLAQEPIHPTVVESTRWFPGITIGRPKIWGDETAVCTTVVYLQTESDQFVRYDLSGGC